jgi:enoyl-CoA hydratase/carnithine racemase
MSSAQLKSTTIGQTMVLTLSNPLARNAMTPEIYAAGVEAFNQADANHSIRSILIQGEGEHFCAGGNVNRLLEQRSLPAHTQEAHLDVLASWVESIRTCSKPVVACVEGAAAGAGFSIALACDFLVAAQNSFFVMAYVNIALSPDGGGSWNLAKQLPRALCSEILMLGGRIDAPRLHQLGLVNELATVGQTYTKSLALCERINQKAPNAVCSIKQLLNQVPEKSLGEHMQLEKACFVENLYHPNAQMGLDAFVQKIQAQYPI